MGVCCKIIVTLRQLRRCLCASSLCDNIVDMWNAIRDEWRIIRLEYTILKREYVLKNGSNKGGEISVSENNSWPHVERQL